MRKSHYSRKLVVGGLLATAVLAVPSMVSATITDGADTIGDAQDRVDIAQVFAMYDDDMFAVGLTIPKGDDPAGTGWAQGKTAVVWKVTSRGGASQYVRFLQDQSGQLAATLFDDAQSGPVCTGDAIYDPEYGLYAARFAPSCVGGAETLEVVGATVVRDGNARPAVADQGPDAGPVSITRESSGPAPGDPSGPGSEYPGDPGSEYPGDPGSEYPGSEYPGSEEPPPPPPGRSTPPGGTRPYSN